MKFAAVFFVIGWIIIALSLLMIIPLTVEMAYHIDDHIAEIFFISMVIGIFIGGMLILTNRDKMRKVSARQAFLITILAWVTTPIFAALPFWLSPMNLSLSDAFFEATSGITTTGATILTDLDNISAGMLLWRSLLQWLGGLGIIVFAMAILPVLQIGGMQLFRNSFSSGSEKSLPPVKEIGIALSVFYSIITLLCAFCYLLSGMNIFDAFNHAMTSVATGGFSTHDDSFGFYDNIAIEMVGSVFMIIGSLPFMLYLATIRGDYTRLLHDTQVRWFFGILLITIIALTIDLAMRFDMNFLAAMRKTIFNVTSILTGTGYASDDYNQWGSFATAIFFIVMFIGGCAGSTSCGLKIFRLQILCSHIANQIRRLIQPNAIFIEHYNNKPISGDITLSVMNFFLLYILSFFFIAVALSATGLDFITALSSAASAIANVGPGLGDMVGPAGNFAAIPDIAKWIMAFGMLLGRLEIITFLVILSRNYWRA